MANYKSNNVQVVTSTAAPVTLPLTKRITAIKYFGGVNSSAAILAGVSTTGNQIWFENKTGVATNVTDLLSIYDSDGVTVSLGGGAVLFIYDTISRGV